MIEEREGSEFQEYDGFTVEYRDKAHRYWLHNSWEILDHQIDGKVERVPATSVTAALGVLDKGEGLRKWYGREDATATLEMERRGELTGIPDDQAIYVVRQRGFGADAQKDAGGERGTAVHRALSAYCEDGTIPKLGEFPEAVRGYVQALCGYLIDASPEPLLVERIVGSPKFGFAGRFDLIANVDGHRILVDAKTSAKPYPEHHVQLAGYQVAFPECGIEPVDSAWMLALADSGTYSLTEVRAEGHQFLAVLSAHRAMSEVRAACRAEEKRQAVLDV